MSFILDALRKSETERQRDSTPDLMRSPVVPMRNKAPPWTGLLISGLGIALALALVALAAAWWNRDRSDGDAAATLETPPSSAPAITAVESVPAPPADRATPAAAANSGEPRPISDLIRADPALPRYTLSFLDYNATSPERSSAWIDGERYYPGQVIAGGPELIGIRADGALLAWRGQTYLLTTR